MNAPARARRSWVRPRGLGVDWAVAAVLIVLAFALPSLLGGGNIPVLITFVTALYLAYSYNVVGGILGDLSLMHMLFWGAGGYAVVIADNHGLNWILIIAVTAVASAIFNVVVVLLAHTLLLRGLFLAIFTLIVFELSVTIIESSTFFGGNIGLFLTTPSVPSQEQLYYIAVGLTIFCVAVNAIILHRQMGLRWLAIRDDSVAAQSVGVNPLGEKASSYAISAVLAVLGGAFAGVVLGYLQPVTAFDLELLIVAVLAVFVGGPGTLWGPLIGTLVVTGVSSALAGLNVSTEVILWVRLLEYVVSFLIIRFVTSRLESGDLVTALGNRLLGGRRRRRAASRPGPSATDEWDAIRAGREAISSVTFELTHVSKSFAGVEVLKDVNCTFAGGTITAVLGPNGAGKTTLCNIVTGFLRQDTGQVLLNGRDISHLSAHRRFRTGVVRTFQLPKVFARLSLVDNVAVAAKGNRDVARVVLARLDVRDTERTAGGVSLFDQRMTEIARVMATSSRVAIFDEPLVGLTSAQHDAVLALLTDLRDTGTAVIVVEHLIPVIAPVADRMVVLDHGVVIADGVPTEVLQSPQVVEAYLGQPMEVAA